MTPDTQVEDSLLEFESKYKTMSRKQLADAAVQIARLQMMACFEYSVALGEIKKSRVVKPTDAQKSR